MYCELPVFRRCCFCLPLRRGILILAYVNVISCMLEAIMSFVTMGMLSSPSRSIYSELPFELDIALLILNAAASIGLIVGLYMKRELLVRLYYYFMIFSMCAAVPLTIIDASMMRYDLPTYFAFFYITISFLYLIFTTVINLYLLLLVRSLMKKLQVSNGHTFGNQLAEFIEGVPADPEQTSTVTVTICDENSPSTKTVPE